MKRIYYFTYLVNIILLFLILFNVITFENISFLKKFLNYENKLNYILILSLIYLLMVILNVPLTPFVTTFSGAFIGVYETFIYIFFVPNDFEPGLMNQVSKIFPCI